jgi:hypothetical protein
MSQKVLDAIKKREAAKAKPVVKKAESKSESKS